MLLCKCSGELVLLRHYFFYLELPFHKHIDDFSEYILGFIASIWNWRIQEIIQTYVQGTPPDTPMVIVAIKSKR